MVHVKFEPMSFGVVLIGLELGAIRLWLEGIQVAKRRLEVCDILAREVKEVSQQHTGNDSVSDKKDVLSHALDLVNDWPEAVDDVQIGLSSRARVAIVEFVLAAHLEIKREALGDFGIGKTVHLAGIELIQHAHFLDIKLLLIKELRSLNASLQHASPHAKVLFCGFAVLALSRWVRVFGIGRSDVAWKGPITGSLFELLELTFTELLPLKHDEIGKIFGILNALFGQLRVAANAVINIVDRLALLSTIMSASESLWVNSVRDNTHVTCNPNLALG